jgi:hypothetical protein
MNITQAFLPYITQDNRIIGVLPIPVTTFNGTETSMVVAGVNTPLALVTPRVSNVVGTPQPAYMAATITPSQERSNFQSAYWLASFIPYGKWNTQLGMSYMVERETTLLQLLRGVNLSSVSSPAVTVVTASNALVEVNWATEVNMTGNNAFIEVNWAVLMTAQSGNASPAYITLDTMTSDPSGGLVKAFVVQSDAPVVNDGVMLNTLRFIKMTNSPVPKGSYVWPAVITNTDGSIANATFTLKNV